MKQLSELPNAGGSTLSSTVLDAKAELSKPKLRFFTMLLIPLALLLLVFRVYRLEQPAFFWLCYLVFGGFAISYWLPFHFRQTFLILLSLSGAFILLKPLVACLLIGVGLLFFAIIRCKVAFGWRVITILMITGIFAYLRMTGNIHIPGDIWPVFGAIFMFRMIVYLYDIKHLSEPILLKDYLGYFFLLPNYYFMLFPVIDFQTFRKSYFKRDIHPVAQQGVWWIFRGTTHLLVYRLAYQLQSSFSPPTAPVVLAVFLKIVFCYLLYLRVSGQFHIIIGMLHLFGYDLPETNRRYLLAHSINDFWRRINVYWKDFMVKICYFPIYFRLRRKGEFRATLVATLLAVVATWLLHAYQFFWLQGHFRISVNDTLFWAALGSLMMVNVWIESRHKNRQLKTGFKDRLRKGAQIAVVFIFIASLWSMWNADSITEWLNFLRSGNI